MATIYSVQSGPWSSTATWQDGNVPGIGDDVYISGSHTVTVDVEHNGTTSYVQSIKILSGGVLKASRTTSSCLITSANSNAFYIYSGGYLDYGTTDDYIPKDYTAKIYSSGSTDNRSFIVAESGSQVTIHGDPGYYGNMYKTSLYNDVSNSNVIKVIGDASDWQPNQELLIYKNSPGGYNDYKSELLKVDISSVGSYNPTYNYTEITMSSSITAYSGSYSLVVNISRNIEIGKFGAQRGMWQCNTGRPTIDIGLCKDLLCKYASFIGHYYLKAPAIGHPDILGNQVIEGCVIRNAQNSLYVLTYENATSNFTIRNNVIFCISYTGYWNTMIDCKLRYVEDSIFIGCNTAMRSGAAKNCLFYCCYIDLITNRHIVNSCDFVNNYKIVRTLPDSIFYNTIFIKNDSICDKVVDSKFNRCYFGQDRNRRIYDNTGEYLESLEEHFGHNKVFMKNCYFIRWPLASVNLRFPPNLRKGQCYFVSYNHNGINGTHRVMSNMADLDRNISVHRKPSKESIYIVPYESFPTYGMFSNVFYKAIEKNVEAGTHTRKIYLAGIGFDNGSAINSSNVILKAKYYDNQGNKIETNSLIFNSNETRWEGISDYFEKVVTLTFTLDHAQDVEYEFRWGCFYLSSYAYLDTKIYRNCSNGRRLPPLDLTWTERGIELDANYV